MEHLHYPSAGGIHTVHACLWSPRTQPRGVIQIIHGMEEYAARYAPFAETAAAHGFLVCAEDHLGHGETAHTPDGGPEFGHFPQNGKNLILQDIAALTEHAAARAPDKPYFLLGHSMGSFFCRVVLARSRRPFAGAVIMGTGYKNKAVLTAAAALTGCTGIIRGWKHKSPVLQRLVFGSYNRKFGGRPGGLEWLSADAANVQAYAGDPLCGFGFTCGGLAGLFSVIREACDRRTFAATDRKLPVFLVAGEDDPVGGFGAGVKKVAEKYKKAGLENVSLKLYPGARHEILNDICAQEASADILSFFSGIAK